jgi:hypothetical protein
MKLNISKNKITYSNKYSCTYTIIEPFEIYHILSFLQFILIILTLNLKFITQSHSTQRSKVWYINNWNLFMKKQILLIYCAIHLEFSTNEAKHVKL